jgi:hypothetical protein
MVHAAATTPKKNINRFQYTCGVMAKPDRERAKERGPRNLDPL